MYDVITIGSALTDIFVKSSQFKIQAGSDSQLLCQLYGDKMEVDDFEIHTGGGGSNTAVGFARQGFKTAVIAEIGKDTLASIIIDDFHREKVSTNLLIQEKREKTGGSVVLIGSDGGRSVLVHRGASSMLDPHDLPTIQLERADWIHLSSISGQTDVLTIIGSTIAKDKKLSWNPGKAELELLNQGTVSIKEMGCQVLLLNQEEWEMIFELQSEVRAIVPEVVVTRGKQGGVFIAGREEFEFDSSHAESVDDTGAGDAFGVGYVTSRIRGQSPLSSIKQGVQNAESVVKQIGAKRGLLFRDSQQ